MKDTKSIQSFRRSLGDNVAFRRRSQMSEHPRFEASTGGPGGSTISVEWMGRRITQALTGWDVPAIHRQANELLAEVKMLFGIFSNEEVFKFPTTR